MLSIYAQSTQYIEVPVTNVQGINPTNDVVQFAFLGPYANTSLASYAIPTAETIYHTGSWQSTSPTSGASTYTAIILVGPDNGGIQLSSGSYLVIVKVTDSPEVPVLFSGPMVVS